ncbi:MAG: hypothetical protein IJW32_05920 [Clostridia bacterium]|nr:hypothetical protein [Clostridia bacterium]
MNIKKLKIVRKIILSLSFIILSVFVLNACSKVNNPQEVSTNVLSEYRKNLFVSKTNFCVATFTSGQREENYIMDGSNTKLVDFGVLTVKFDNYTSQSLPKFELKINNDLYTGEFEHNPYDNTFVFDIQKQVSDNDTLNLYLVDFDQSTLLQCCSKNWKINYKQAHTIFTEKYKTEITSHTTDNVLKGEVYIKIVSDDKDLKNFYWYVLLVCQNGDMYSSLIDVNSGEIVQN